MAGLSILGGCARNNHRQPTPSHSITRTNANSELSPLSERQIKAFAHYAAGLSFDLRDEPKGALDEYLLSAQADPKFEPVVVETAKRLLRAREFDRAIDFISGNLAQAGSIQSLYPVLAIAYASVGKTNQAMEACRVGIKKTPLNLANYIHLTQLYVQSGKTNDAIRVLGDAGRQPSLDPAYWLALTELFTRFEKQKALNESDAKSRILSATDKAFRLKPKDATMLQRIAETYLACDQVEKAETIYADLFKTYPDQKALRERLTNLYLRSGKKAEAAQLLEALKRDSPTDPQSYYLLGTLAYEAKNYTNAVENYEKVLQLNPSFEPVYYDLAGLHISMHKPGQALDLLQRARSRFKLNFTLEFYSGVALGLMEKSNEALNHFTSAEIIAKASEPTRINHLFYYQLGAAHERVGNIADAVINLKKSLELRSDYAESQNYLGYMWADRGENLDEAQELIQKALKSSPDNPAFLDSFAWVLHRKGKNVEALKQIKLAIVKSMEPDSTLVEHLGDIYLQLNRKDEAVEAWRHSLKIQSNEKVKDKLRRLTDSPLK